MYVYSLVCACGYEADALDAYNDKIELQRRPVTVSVNTVCQECGQPRVEEVQIWRYVCPSCGKCLVETGPDEDVETEAGEFAGKTFNIGGDNYGKSIVSDALAINPSQTAEHREHFPDVEVRSDGRPVFKNFRQHDDYLEKTGFVKRKQRVKPKGEIIARMK